MEDIIVIDDCISTNNQKFIQEICRGTGFPWFYFDTSNYNPNLSLNNLSKQELEIYNNRSNYFDAPQFGHLILDEGIVNSNYISLLTPLLSAIPFQIEQLLKIKFNMKHPRNNVNFGVPHTDLKLKSFMTAIYYVNDCDGDTVIFNQKKYNEYEPLTVKQSVSPKQGRLVIFDGLRYHSAGNPSLRERTVININFIAK